MLENCEALAAAAHRETGLGRVEDKIVKNRLVTEKTPGLEDLHPRTVTGDHGLTLTEPAPFGVIAAITPCTNPTSTIICNAIGMLAAGNSVVFNAHPAAKECSAQTVVLLNRAVTGAGGPPNAVTCVTNPTIESAQALMRHPGVRLLVVTGGGAVVQAAMASGKRAICAGPGNPPAVVDETADIDKAARDIVLGASTDNNIICVDEKEVVCVASVADKLVAAMTRQGAVLVPPHQLRKLEALIFAKQHGPRHHAEVNRDLIGKNAADILAGIGISAPAAARLAVVEVNADHPLLWTEQMMPVMPVCRVQSADAAIDLAVAVEGGNRHTAVMHSRNIDALSRMARACNCSIFVKNGRSQAGLGLDGEGYCSFTIASPTGEGLTGPRSFSRARRCVLVDHFRIT
jgi:acyl-CoA reductase-like NAD-dependent aldehyde dehydrogenase